LKTRSERATEHKHDDVEEKENQDQKQTENEWCGWGDHAPLEAKIDFIKTIGLFSTDTSPDVIAKYVITLEQINAVPNLSEAIWQLFGIDNAHVRRDTEYNIRCNLSFCFMLSNAELKDTPLVPPLLTTNQWDVRIHRLQKIHADNVRWFRHMVAAKEARNLGRNVEPLYEGPTIDDESKANAARDGIKPTEAQLLLEFMFQKAGENRLRRTEKAVYAPVLTPAGHNTRCYELLADMDAWVRKQVTPKDNFPAQFHWLTKKGDTPRYIENHLGKQPDQRFPFLKRCRTLFSYRNGIYDANDNKFYFYVTPASPIHHDHIHTVYELPDDVATAKYFNYAVPTAWFAPGFDYRTIRDEVQHHEKIFKYQDYTDDELEWVEAFLGRLQHDVGTKEDWASAIHLEGPGKTGKSLFLKLIQLWYYATDIGLIGDNVENNFPDQHLVDKFIVMCMDVSREFGLSPTRFLLWCAGDWLEVHYKGKEARCMKWKAPTMWASNNKPAIAASGGAAKRRYIILQFFKAVLEADSHLFRHATEEVGAFIIKCSMAYHEKLKKYSKYGLYDQIENEFGKKTYFLPPRFIRAINEYGAACSYADAFLQHSMFEYHSDPAFADLSPDLFVLNACEFQTEFDFFKGRTMLPGVNKYRPPTIPECNAQEFANALAEHGCVWDVQDKLIYGIRINVEKERELAQQPVIDKRSKKGGGGGYHKPPIPVADPSNHIDVVAAPVAPRPVASSTFSPPPPPNPLEFGPGMFSSGPPK